MSDLIAVILLAAVLSVVFGAVVLAHAWAVRKVYRLLVDRVEDTFEDEEFAAALLTFLLGLAYLIAVIVAAATVYGSGS